MAGMELDTTIFDSIHSWTHSVYQLENLERDSLILHSPTIRVTILDSGYHAHPPLVAAIFIPKGRDNDPLFCTRSGYLQLLEKYFNVSRLIVVGNDTKVDVKSDYIMFIPSESDKEKAQEVITPMINRFLPTSLRDQENAIKFLNFSDGLIFRQFATGGSSDSSLPMGSYAITDEVVKTYGSFEMRRRLRFDQSGDWVHTESRVLAINSRTGAQIAMNLNCNWANVRFVIKKGELLDAHNRAMIFGMKPLYPSLKGKQRRALCMGATASLMMDYLSSQLSFEVVRVDASENLFSAMDVFELLLPSRVRMDPMEILGSQVSKTAVAFRNRGYTNFDVVMVDLKQHEPRSLSGCCSPPRSMITVDALSNLKSLISDTGAVIIHVSAPDSVFHAELICNLKGVFKNNMYQIRLSGERHCILVATTGAITTPSAADVDADDAELLKTTIPHFKIEEIVNI